MVIWVTGISGSGKTTLCEAMKRRVKPTVPELVLLDGDVIREIFGNDLGFTEIDRTRQIRRIQSIARELDRQNLVVLVAALYANPELLQWNRQNFSEYYEVYLKASVQLVKSRDPKGLYAKVERGEMKDVVGLDIPWHEPQHPDLVVDAASVGTPDELAKQVIGLVRRLSALD